MKRIINRFISLMLVFTILLGITITTGAESANDIKSHWAEETLSTWEKLSLLKGDENGNINPDSDISRVEFMALINRLMDYKEKSDKVNDYSDVSSDGWYFEDISKALAAGYIKGITDNTMEPYSAITREQAISIISRIKGFDSEKADRSVLNNVIDRSDISSWAEGYVAAAINKGLVTGNESKINPGANITRAEAIVLLDRVRTNTRTFSFPGTYGSAGGIASYSTVVISSSGVVLNNAEITGNLHITEAVGEGEVDLSNVKVGGDLLVDGGGQNSIHIESVIVEGDVVVHRDDEGKVRIVVSGDSEINVVTVETGAILVTQNLTGEGIKEVSISSDFIGDSAVEFVGEYNSITNNHSDADILLGDAHVKALNLNAGAKIEHSGNSSIDTANISELAGKDTHMDIKPNKVAGSGVPDADIKDSSANNSGTSGSSSGSSKSGSSKSSSTKTYTITFDYNYENAPEPVTQVVKYGKTANIPALNITSDGYYILGWYTDSDCTQLYDFTSLVYKNKTIYAKVKNALDAAAESLTFDIIKGSNESVSSIVYDLSLPTVLIEYPGVLIDWTSSDTSVISNTGIVTRPNDSNASVTLTAIITAGVESMIKTFDIIVTLEKPYVKNVTVYDVNTIIVTFNEALNWSTVSKSDFVVKDENGDKIAIKKVTLYSDDEKSVAVDFYDDLFYDDLEGDYTITISDIEDTAGNIMDSITINLNSVDKKNPTIYGAILYNAGAQNQMIRIKFSEAMATSGTYSVLDLSKYTLVVDDVYHVLSDDDSNFYSTVYIGNDDESVVLSIISTVDDINNGIDLDSNDKIIVGRVADAAGNYIENLSTTLSLNSSSSISIDLYKAKATAVNKLKLTIDEKVDFDESDLIVWADIDEDGTIDSSEQFEIDSIIQEYDDGETIVYVDLDSDFGLNTDATYTDIENGDDFKRVPVKVFTVDAGDIKSKDEDEVPLNAIAKASAITVTDDIDPSIAVFDEDVQDGVYDDVYMNLDGMQKIISFDTNDDNKIDTIVVEMSEYMDPRYINKHTFSVYDIDVNNVYAVSASSALEAAAAEEAAFTSQTAKFVVIKLDTTDEDMETGKGFRPVIVLKIDIYDLDLNCLDAEYQSYSSLSWEEDIEGNM